MSRRKRAAGVAVSGTGTPVSKDTVEWGGFVEIRLTEDDKQDFESWCDKSPDGYRTDLLEALAGGCKLGVSYVSDGDYFLATFTASGLDRIGLEARWCLSARAPTMEMATALLCYKHFVLAEGNWGQYKTNGFKGERFG